MTTVPHPGDHALVFATAFGPFTLWWSGEAVTAARLPATGDPPAPVADPPDWLAALTGQVARHLAGEFQDFSAAPFAWDRVTPFQQRVYRTALQVPAGQTWTYGRLAVEAGLPPSAARAVGAALAANPWPLLVPCHRFTGADGGMVGFSAEDGVAMKLRLLRLEGADWFAC